MRPSLVFAAALFVSQTLAAVSFAAPAISHTPAVDATHAGDTFEVSATIASTDPLQAVELLVRSGDAIEWLTLPMVDVGDGLWTAGVDADLVVRPDVDYYLRATDNAAEPKTTTLPAGAPEEHFVVQVEDASADGTMDSDGGCASASASRSSAGWLGLLLGFAAFRRQRHAVEQV